jgi:hypothetical protein
MSAQSLKTCVLKDVIHGQPGEQPVTVAIENHNLALIVHPKGYGVYDDDDSAPILLERHKGKLRLIVWADINSQEPTHIIDLEGARVDVRQKEENHG